MIFFNENQSVALRNDVMLALEKHDASTAQRAWETLTRHESHDAAAGPLLLLIVHLLECSPTPFQNHADLRAAWLALAARAAALLYQPRHPDEHAAPFWLQSRQWQAAANAVAQIESWRRIPAPLSWMLHACLQLQGLLTELAWLAPQRLESVLQQTAEPILQTLVHAFEERFEGAGQANDLVWFPAWVLTERPALAPALTQAHASQHTQPAQAMHLIIELLGLERQGRQREVLEHCKTLRRLNGARFYTAALRLAVCLPLRPRRYAGRPKSAQARS